MICLKQRSQSDSESREEVVSPGCSEGGVKKQSELCAWDSNDVGIIS